MMYKLDQDRVPLLEAMKKYANCEVAQFDVPGHKRGRGVVILNEYFGKQIMRLDTNSLPLLDNVGNPTGVIKEAQAMLADAYGAKSAFFIVNGSTLAIHAMLMAVLSPGDKVLMPKNIHKSALNGLILCGAIPIYMNPEVCPQEKLSQNVSVSEVRRLLDASPDVVAVFVLNPTYFGYVSDLQAISHLCHERGVLLLVDEAHGAHFPFHPQMPPSAMACDADLSCISLHKTGGALTQASALIVKSHRVDLIRVQQVLNILQSTSASYLLMGSLDGARYNLVKHGCAQIEQAISLSNQARAALSKVAGLSVVSAPKFYDVTKLIINVSGLALSGFAVYELLWREYDVQLELCETNHVLAIISLGDCAKSIDKLVMAMRDIACKYPGNGSDQMPAYEASFNNVIVQQSPRDAYFSRKELVKLADAVGRIAGETVMTYPPGIPIISPGELVTNDVVRVLKDLKAHKAFIVDNTDSQLEKILVVVEE